MKRLVCILFCLCAFLLVGCRQKDVHPHIFATDADKASIRQMIADEEWASMVFQRLKDKVEPYADRHVADPEWLVSRLAMYWKDGEHYTQCYLKDQNWERGEGNAPVPTVRMPGMRTWNKYVNVPLEERTPYNETGDMWGIDRSNPDAPKVLVPYKESGHMIRSNNVEILTLAEEAAFLYWLTGEEKYGAMAADVFHTWLVGTYYMNPILDPDKSTGGEGGYEPGGICGYYDYEQIHDDLAFHAAVVYDFAYDYLKAHPHPHLQKLGMSLPEVAGIVFKRFIDIGFVRGGKSGNWNVNGWNMMLRPILALEEDDAYPDGKGRSYYLLYLTTESTPYHDAIPDILKAYDPVTGLWPESPGYAFGTVAGLLDFAALLQREGIDVLKENPILQKAALAVFPWMDERGNMIVFGDSRGGSANFITFERLLAYYQSVGNEENVKRVASALQAGITNGSYRREETDWTSLCLYASAIPSVNAEEMAEERMSYSPFHRLVTMKSRRGEENLMAVLYGGRDGSHLTPNGLSLQLYGFGYALAPDAAGYESYWSADKIYHQSPTGSNTILPGYTAGDIRIHAMEPQVDTAAFVNATALNPFVNLCDMEAGEKRRVVAMVKTTSDQGYYVDVFRSAQSDNDYLFHNVGTSLHVEGINGTPLPLTGCKSIGKMYGEGYKWFSKLQKADCPGDFHAVWKIAPHDTCLWTMQMWMTGVEGRELYCMEAPYTTLNPSLTPGGVSAAPHPTPTLLVRQTGVNGWESPFIAVYQPVRGEHASVKTVKRLGADGQKVMLCVSSEGERKDYIYSAVSAEAEFPQLDELAFQGLFGLASEVSGEVSQLYMVNARKIKQGAYAIEADEPVSASVYRENGKWYYSSTGNVKVTIAGEIFEVGQGFHSLLKETVFH